MGSFVCLVLADGGWLTVWLGGFRGIGIYRQDTGHFGQFIYVSPQHDAVFVRNGPGRGAWGDRDWTELFYFAAERL